MDTKRRRGILALLLVLSLGNYFRMHGQDTKTAVQFFSIFIIGAFSGILISDLAALYKSRKGDKDRVI